MTIHTKELEIVNKAVYENLEKFLKKLNKRIHLKLYSLVYDDKGKLKPVVRIKKTVVIRANTYPITHDILPDLNEVYKELKIKPIVINDSMDTAALKDCLDKKNYETFLSTEPAPEINDDPSEEEDLSASQTVQEDKRVIYTNKLELATGKSQHTLTYILEISNVDPASRELFYHKPQYSFLRMALDYFFLDFFAVNDDFCISLNSDKKLSTRYNEDPVQYNRRMARLFFGKMQAHLFKTKDRITTNEFNHYLSSDYYIHNLLEQMDEIAGLPYEGASPFGSIVFLHEQAIANANFIRFSIRFTLQDRIQLDDAKRIRKLLELTHEGKDLYLIADHSHIYGLGEVNWNLQQQTFVLRLDFNGLSKFNLTLVCTEAEQAKEGRLIVEDERKYYRSDLALVESPLLSISSKNPRLGEEGYSSERFVKLLENVFWGGKASEINKQNIKALDLIVRKARTQKHGTMVVITTPTTAEQELIILSKQSTLIKTSPINPEHIKFLTAIDGAIYFDTSADCHAIGVILDGNAKADIGDSSRGARFNSAHRYLHKLKDEKKENCVIAIISEDGMVDLIPEVENEDQLLAIAMEIVDLVSEEQNDPEKQRIKEQKLKTKEEALLVSKIVDSEWLFKVGQAYSNRNLYQKALLFLNRAMERAENEYIMSNYYNLIGTCYHNGHKGKEQYEIALEMYEKALQLTNKEVHRQIYLGNIGIVASMISDLYQDKDKNTKEYRTLLEKAVYGLSESIEIRSRRTGAIEEKFYRRRASSYQSLSVLEVDKELKEMYLRKAIEDYKLSIQSDPEKSYLYFGKALIHISLKEFKDAALELITAIGIKTEKKHWDSLLFILRKQPDLIATVSAHYNRIANQDGLPEELDKLHEVYLSSLEIPDAESTAAAAAKEQRPLEDDQDPDSLEDSQDSQDSQE